MGIISTDLVHSLGGTDMADGSSTAALVWRVITDSVYDDHFTVCESPDLPKKASDYDFYGKKKAGLYLSGYTAALQSTEDSRKVWQVTGNYTTQVSPSDNKENEQTGDPLDMTPRVSSYTQKERVQFLRDLEGRLVASSAGEPYDPVQEVTRTRVCIRIVRNVKRLNPEFNQKFADKLNSTIYFGFPAELVLCENPGTWEILYTSGGTRYFQETWEFSLPIWNDFENDWESRQVKLYDYGMYKIVAGERENIKDSKNKELTSATLLNGAGVPLDYGDDPVFLPEFKAYRLIDFKALGLPETV